MAAAASDQVRTTVSGVPADTVRLWVWTSPVPTPLSSSCRNRWLASPPKYSESSSRMRPKPCAWPGFGPAPVPVIWKAPAVRMAFSSAPEGAVIASLGVFTPLG